MYGESRCFTNQQKEKTIFFNSQRTKNRISKNSGGAYPLSVFGNLAAASSDSGDSFCNISFPIFRRVLLMESDSDRIDQQLSRVFQVRLLCKSRLKTVTFFYIFNCRKKIYITPASEFIALPLLKNFLLFKSHFVFNIIDKIRKICILIKNVHPHSHLQYKYLRFSTSRLVDK